MKLEDGVALTHWQEYDGTEWDIRIKFSYQESEGPDYEEGHMVYPGCDAGIVDMQVERKEYCFIKNGLVNFDGSASELKWVEFPYATDEEEAAWAVEILEAINQQFMDDRGNEP